jgi:hypothetical protein
MIPIIQPSFKLIKTNLEFRSVFVFSEEGGRGFVVTGHPIEDRPNGRAARAGPAFSPAFMKGAIYSKCYVLSSNSKSNVLCFLKREQKENKMRE